MFVHAYLVFLRSNVANDNSLEKISSLKHTPEMGFTDIKPFEIENYSLKNITSYSLISISGLLAIYFLYKKRSVFLPKRIIKTLSKEEYFIKTLNDLENSDLGIREYCEELSYALRALITSYVKYNITSMTSFQLSNFLDAKINLIFPTLSKTELDQNKDQIIKLCSKFEAGEYGDIQLIKTLEEQKKDLHKDTLELGKKIVSYRKGLKIK